MPQQAAPIAVETVAINVPQDLHPATVDLVQRFASAMAQKLLLSQRKYGYTDGWADPRWAGECREELIRHLSKGDPLDVANFCAFLWHHGESTAAPADSALTTT